MKARQTKLTSQCQLSMPAAIVQTKDIGRITVQRAVRHTTEDAHKALFGDESSTIAPKSLQDLKQGIKQHMKQKQARH